MALIVKPYTFTAGATIVASEHNSNFDTIINDYNGNITNANISASAAISATKLSLGSIAQAITDSATFTMSGAAINFAKGSDISSNTTTDIGAATGNCVDVTGTTTITGLGTVQSGTIRFVRFTNSLLLTYNATSLILPTLANIQTAAGDTAIFESLGSGNWVCIAYQRADGTPLASATASTALTGSVVQVAHADGFSKVTGNTNLPMDNTKPQITEGTQIMTLAITPYSATNKLKVTVVAYVSQDVGNGAGCAVALFNTDVHATDAIMTGYTHTGNQTSVNSLDCVTFVAYTTAGTTSSTTFKVRMGAATTNVYFNSDIGTDMFNGTFGSSITIEEIKV